MHPFRDTVLLALS